MTETRYHVGSQVLWWLHDVENEHGCAHTEHVAIGILYTSFFSITNYIYYYAIFGIL